MTSPPSNAMSVSPDDTSDLGHPSRCINVAVPGSVRVTTVSGDTATVFIAAGVTFPLRARRIWATGTTASGITVLY
jgi:hypothetical protein